MDGQRFLLVAAVMCVFGACAATPKKVDDAFAQSPLAKELDRNWVVEVTEDSWTFLPKGYPLDAPRTSSDGEWVYVSEKKRMRWFIPKHGVRGIPRDELHSQAEEGSVALKVAGVKWVTWDNIAWWGKEAGVGVGVAAGATVLTVARALVGAGI